MMQAFTDKNYPVESNQARWISTIVDFFVDSIITTVSTTYSSSINNRYLDDFPSHCMYTDKGNAAVYKSYI